MSRNDEKEPLRERLSLTVARNPSRAILLGILLFNFVFFLVAAAIIAFCAPTADKEFGFWQSVFYTISMVLDAGCVNYVVTGTEEGGGLLTVICVLVVIVGMISFTGAVIGYVTTWISEFIRDANAGNRPLNISDHTVLLNWNSRASEIINDLLFSEDREKVVVLVESGKEEVEREIAERLADTLQREREKLTENRQKLSAEELRTYKRLNHGMKDNVSVVVRQGTIYSSKQLRDISIGKAKSVILLSNDNSHSICDAERLLRQESGDNTDPEIIKALIQVAEITAADSSRDNQKVVVEVNDEWTSSLVQRIIARKERAGKCNIVPIAANQVLGRILSQLAIMPDLNQVYSELFSNRGACFFSERYPGAPESPNELDFVRDYSSNHDHAVPLTCMTSEKEGLRCFFMAESQKAVSRTGYRQPQLFDAAVNRNFAFKRRNVLVLGCTSEMGYLMEGFNGFYAEWADAFNQSPIDLTIVAQKDDPELEGLQDAYPFVSKVAPVDISAQEDIYAEIEAFLEKEGESASILLLSDDRVPAGRIDANVLVNLIYVKDILGSRGGAHGTKERDVDVIVEILDPRNYDVVLSYDINNVVISNRYISRMLTQISEHEAIFDFYMDILTYDEEGEDDFVSKELYIKPARDFFDEIPGTCTADVLIRSVFESCLHLSEDYVNHTLLLGYIREGEMKLLSGNQERVTVTLEPDDQLIIFSNH